jgi:alpha-aminoadipate/glutamate carrier protein LysW
VAAKRRKQEMPICPECDTDLDLDEEELEEGEIVSCPECGTDFEVVTKSPLELNPVDEFDEDEDDDEDDEEEEEDEF